ncbi:MAG: PKD domain-containing protein [Methanomicrobium sp.]|nr:PKD domain-containing protein [Methanomicrobium sp.]
MERNTYEIKAPVSVSSGLLLLFALFALFAIISPASAAAMADFKFEQGNPNSAEYLRVIYMGSLEGATATEDSQWVWNFGDGTTGTGKNVVHTYSADILPTNLHDPVIFMVRLDVTPDGGGKPCSKSYKVEIKEPSLAAQFSLSATQGPPPLEVTVTDTSFGRHDIESLYFGYPGSDTTVSSLPATHVYDREGTYPVTLTVSRGDETSKATKQVIVRKDAIYIGSENPESSDSSDTTGVTDAAGAEETAVPDTPSTQGMPDISASIVSDAYISSDTENEPAAAENKDEDFISKSVGSLKLQDAENIVGVKEIKAKRDRYLSFFEEIIKLLRSVAGLPSTV